MADDKVLNFPQAQRSSPEVAAGPPVTRPRQLDLFSGNQDNVRTIVYLSLEHVDQDLLLNTFIKHAVQTIIDLRARPVFPKPRFDHKYLMSYFYQRSMNYIELAMISSLANSEQADDCNPDRLSSWMADAQQTGFTACIIDSAAIEGGHVASFRRRIARSPNQWLEVHPRSILS
jgi:hypothetical protein